MSSENQKPTWFATSAAKISSNQAVIDIEKKLHKLRRELAAVMPAFVGALFASVFIEHPWLKVVQVEFSRIGEDYFGEVKAAVDQQGHNRASDIDAFDGMDDDDGKVLFDFFERKNKLAVIVTAGRESLSQLLSAGGNIDGFAALEALFPEHTTELR
ncbi:hypothetical protein LP417_35055 (plasmid) [Polaromonas sp. P1-6]|nr:hypothetical protein LP417_35055 [Polaromonas sp. P1-6]